MAALSFSTWPESNMGIEELEAVSVMYEAGESHGLVKQKLVRLRFSFSEVLQAVLVNSNVGLGFFSPLWIDCCLTSNIKVKRALKISEIGL